MKRIRSKKTVLVAGMAALLALSGCESKEKKAEREAEAERERVAAIEQERREAERLENNLAYQIADSLMNVPNTINGMSAKQVKEYCGDFKYELGLGTRYELDSLENVKMRNVLCKKVVSSAKPIAEKHLKALYASLSTYNLGINEKERIHQILSGEPYDTNSYNGVYYWEWYGAEKSDTIYGMYDDVFDFGQSNFVDAVLFGADTAKFGAVRQKEIVNTIKNQYVKMMLELKQNRIAIAKEFADYYPVLDLNRVPKQYSEYVKNYDPAIYAREGEGYYSFDYLPTSFGISKSVTVYDSKLKPEFFNVPDAKYQLVKVSQGKWQVIRTLKNGKVDKTPVFTHNVDYKTQLVTYLCDDVKQGEYSFYATAGANMGVYITVDGYEYIARAKKSDELPDVGGKRAARIAELQKKAQEVHVLDSTVWEYNDAAYKKAREMAQRRLGRNR